MRIIENLHEYFTIDTKEEAANQDAIEQLKSFSTINIPEEYIEIIMYATEIEISVQKSIYIRIWSPEGYIELNEAYKIQESFPESLAIGDDEG